MLKKVFALHALNAILAEKPIEVAPNRIYNCAFAPIDDWRVFSEVMFLLLGGTGVGL